MDAERGAQAGSFRRGQEQAADLLARNLLSEALRRDASEMLNLGLF